MFFQTIDQTNPITDSPACVSRVARIGDVHGEHVEPCKGFFYMKKYNLSTSKDTPQERTKSVVETEQTPDTECYLPDLTDPIELRKAFIASEIFRRKY